MVQRFDDGPGRRRKGGLGAVAPGFVDKNNYQLTTGTNPFNVFARIGAGLIPAHKEDNEALKRAGDAVSKDYTARFMVARNRPENDLNWDKGAETEGGKWHGVASMSARHRSDECVSNTRARM